MVDISQEIADYMYNSNRFLNEGNERQFHMINKRGDKIGYLWFKNLLGGWRLMLDSDKGGEWEERGPIKNVEHLKTFLN